MYIAYNGSDLITIITMGALTGDDPAADDAAIAAAIASFRVN